MDAVKVGLIGIGRAGWGMHLKEMELFPGKFALVAAADVLEERRDKIRERFPACRTYADAAALMADPEVELVVVACRSPEHAAYAVAALEQGKQVFLEKPVVTTEEGLRTLAAATRRCPERIYFRQNRRFEPAFNHIREIMASGVLGEVYEIKLCRHGYQRRKDWQTLTDCGGGQLNNWGPHLIDQGLQLLESPLADLWGDLKKTVALGDAEDHLKIIMRGENGRLIDIEISGGVAIPSPVYAVYGTRGALISPDEQDFVLKYLEPDQTFAPESADAGTPDIFGRYGNAENLRWRRKTIMVEPANQANVTDIYGHVYAAMREGKPFPVRPEEALQVAEVTLKVKAMCAVRQYRPV